MICISLIFLVNIIIKSADCESSLYLYGRYNIQVGVIFEVKKVLNSDKVKIEKKIRKKVYSLWLESE